LTLLLFHPGAASVACSDCKKWHYNLKTGKRETYRSGPEKKELPMERRPGEPPPPCHTCPKKSPDREHEFRLSTKNWQTVQLYWEVQATRGVCLNDAEREDEVLLANLAIVDAIWRRAQQQELVSAIGQQVLPYLMRR